MNRPRAAAYVVGAVTAGLLAAAPGAAGAAPARPDCRGAYAEDLQALSARSRELEAAAAAYSYAVRTTATYECVAYGADGNVKRVREHAMAYGTAFGYRHDGDDTLLVTNQHVAEWPAVTDPDHPVDGVPAGCKRIADALTIVDGDKDRYAADDIPLTRVAVDPQLDVAVLRAHAALAILPWQIGTSAALTTRTVVVVKGFPLGAFQATNVGKIISPLDRDTQGERDHDDFVVDALLSQAGSGSPVLAVSCQTGAFELVGIFHARYSEGSALNLVVAIDQVRPLLTTLRRTTQPRPQPGGVADAAARARLIAALRGDELPVFPFGGLVADVRATATGSLVFRVFGDDFPRSSQPRVQIEDLPAPTGFGQLGAVHVGGASGLALCEAPCHDADGQAITRDTLDHLRQAALATFAYRAAAAAAPTSRDAVNELDRQRRALVRLTSAQREPSHALLELAERVPTSPVEVRAAARASAAR